MDFLGPGAPSRAAHHGWPGPGAAAPPSSAEHYNHRGTTAGGGPPKRDRDASAGGGGGGSLSSSAPGPSPGLASGSPDGESGAWYGSAASRVRRRDGGRDGGSGGGTGGPRRPTPLDPLLKHLRREYGSSAGPADVLASRVSPSLAAEVEEILASSGSSLASRRRATLVRSIAEGGNTDQSSVVGKEIVGGPDVVGESQQQQREREQREQRDNYIQQPPHLDRSATPMASGSGVPVNRPHAPSYASTENSNYSPDEDDSRDSPRRSGGSGSRAMPHFCHSPPCHVDGLLRDTPRLRHLSPASAASAEDREGGRGRRGDFLGGLLGGKRRDDDDSLSSSHRAAPDIRSSIVRARSNAAASSELASFITLLSNEMSQERFASVESEVYSRVFALVQSRGAGADDRLAGVAAIDALVGVPSSDESYRAVRFGNSLSNGLKAPGAGYEFLHAVARALGRMAVGASNVDRVEFEISRALEWLRSDRSDRRLAAVLVLRELARCAPTAFYGKTQNVNVLQFAATASRGGGGGGGAHHHHHGAGASSSLLAGLGGTNDFLDHIGPVLRDPQPVVRACAADALSECLSILMERQHRSMTAPLCSMYFDVLDGLRPPPPSDDHHDPAGLARSRAVRAHGALLVVSEMLRHAPLFMLPRLDEVCALVLSYADHAVGLLRLEVVRLIPRLARVCPQSYGRRYLRESLAFLVGCCASSSPTSTAKSKSSRPRTQPYSSSVDVRPCAFRSLGQLALAMSDNTAGGEDLFVACLRIEPESEEDVLSRLAGESDDDGGADDGGEDDDDDLSYYRVELRDVSDFEERVDEIFRLISDNIRPPPRDGGGGTAAPVPRCDVLGCLANFVEALGSHAASYVMPIVEDMFDAGLSENLITCLHSLAASLPSKQLAIARRLFEEISFCLAGTRSPDVTLDLFFSSRRQNTRPTFSDADSLTSVPSVSSLDTMTNHRGALERNFMSSMSLASLNPMRPRSATETTIAEEGAMVVQHLPDGSNGTSDSGPGVRPPLPTGRADDKREGIIVINDSAAADDVDKLVLSLRTLRTIGESYNRLHEAESSNMLLPFLRDVIMRYFSHPSDDVRREAAVTCCLLLLPFGDLQDEDDKSILRIKLGSVSSVYTEDILQKLLRLAVADQSPIVRLCIVQGLDARYDPYLSQLFLLSPLFLMLEDEALAVRACALQILGRLSRLNPAAILPGLRQVLCGLIVELQCGGDNAEEVATRLIILFLREEALQRLTRPFISAIVDSLPLEGAPRLVSASFEALGELANVAHNTISPWLRQLIPLILDNVQDQNGSKKRVSLWALGRIAYGTGYVVTPYLDYPEMLERLSEILPTTKKAIWELRREGALLLSWPPHSSHFRVAGAVLNSPTPVVSAFPLSSANVWRAGRAGPGQVRAGDSGEEGRGQGLRLLRGGFGLVRRILQEEGRPRRRRRVS